MFSREEAGRGPARDAAMDLNGGAPAVPSLISKDLQITGDVESDGEIQIDGEIIGDVKGETLIIGNEARVEGNLTARDLRVSGVVQGDIAGRTVTVAKCAQITGDVTHESLEVEAGAHLEGRLHRNGAAVN